MPLLGALLGEETRVNARWTAVVSGSPSGKSPLDTLQNPQEEAKVKTEKKRNKHDQKESDSMGVCQRDE
jgi:hypothetical protein